MLFCWNLALAFPRGTAVISQLRTIVCLFTSASYCWNYNSIITILLSRLKILNPSWNESWTKMRLDSACWAFPASEHWQRILFQLRLATGGRTTLLGISKRGNKKIRTLLVQCARVFIQKLEHQSGKLADWVRDLLCRKRNFVVTCALANKLARIA